MLLPSNSLEAGPRKRPAHVGRDAIRGFPRRDAVAAAFDAELDGISADLVLDLLLPNWSEQSGLCGAQQDVTQAGRNEDACIENGDRADESAQKSPSW